MKALGFGLAVAGICLLVPQVFLTTPYQPAVAGGIILAVCGGGLISDAGVSEEE